MELKGSEVKKRTHINGDQKNVLIDFMNNHPELRSGKFSSSFTYKQAQKLWEEVTQELNAIPGVLKDWKQWRKTWQDIRCSAKANNTKIKNYRKETGGGPSCSQSLSQTEENVLTIIGSTAVDGLETVEESIVNVDWGDNSEKFEIEYILDNTVTEELQSEENDENQINSSNIETTTKIISQEMPLTMNNTMPKISVDLMSNMTPKNKGRLRSSAARRFEKSVNQTEKLAAISEKDCEIRRNYYKEKLRQNEIKLQLGCGC